MSDLAAKIREQATFALTAEQLEDIHKIIERHSTDVVDYELAADDINAYLPALVSREVVLGLVAERESVLEEVFKHALALVRLYDDEDASWQAESDVEHSLKEAVKKVAAERQMKRGSDG